MIKSLIFSLALLFTKITTIESLNIPVALNYMNTFRKTHQVSPLVHDREITKFSKEWAQHILDTGRFEHSNNRDYGENIAYTYSPSHYKSFVRSTNMFYNEESLYDYTNPVFSFETGHFTQLVWKSSTDVGIGMVSNGTITVLVTNFWPPGNFQGRFQNNVLLPLD